ncbi:MULTISPECIES: LTA synthase family protein [Cohnella]|jgi:phosphoglycerol transferase MdoB-like AlkP superfamily enzyme|uniref:LTA synthase family protein n=1 Tax=Cohnella TaxID=329857 RepID=UPI000E36CF70|nr:LTA synthase family protein [Cohnella sp.]REK66596.1 MAG: sulfatase [Cohnella sp.]
MSLLPPHKLLRNKPFVFFTIILLLKSCLAWFVIFDDGPSWRTVLTEIPFFWILFCLIEWFSRKHKLAWYLLVNLFITAILFSVFMYYKYYGVIATYHALEQVNQVTAVSNSVFSLMDPYYVLIFIDVVILGIMLFSSKKVQNWKRMSARRENRKVIGALFTLSVILCLFNILPNRASMNERTKAEEMGILNYELYSILDQSEEEIVDKKEITQAAIDKLKGVQPVQHPSFWQAAKGKNLIIIQLESFQNFLIGLKIDGQEVTPNMNKLAKENFYFSNFYQMVGQGNTSDAEYVVNTSLYIPPHGAATMNYVKKALPSLPKLLASHGYDTATFHTNVVEFWNRGELYKAVGFDRYYDKDFFGTEDAVFFGASDEVLYRKTAPELKKMDDADRPFYAHVISMTAHHPFTIPEDKYYMKLPERFEGTFVGDYIRAQNYADHALGEFIDELKANGVWDNSVIVIYGDHLGLPIYSLDNNEKALMEEIYGRPYGYTDMINIPLIVASTGITYPSEFKQTGGQVDILPTVANLLGVPLDQQIHFGQDLLNSTQNLLPERYYLPSGSVIDDSHLFIPGSGYDDGVHYSLEDNSTSESGITEDQYERALELLRLSDSYVKQLPDKDPPEQ